ncbi:MAG: hypothetical protein K0Q72_1270, partial [Armatimonadetes bacterium]|nr:hypothetical protein [Armatimonadota bacterium]
DMDPLVEGADTVTQRAFELLTSNRVFQAMDVEKEDPIVRERYGRGSLKNVDDGGPMWNDGLLIARRLVETGVRCITIGYGRWDYHGNNFGQLKERLPILDQGISALIQDLHDRGMDKDVSVVVWGEMGRTPQINKDGGRRDGDHLPQHGPGHGQQLRSRPERPADAPPRRALAGRRADLANGTS